MRLPEGGFLVPYKKLSIPLDSPFKIRGIPLFEVEIINMKSSTNIENVRKPGSKKIFFSKFFFVLLGERGGLQKFFLTCGLVG